MTRLKVALALVAVIALTGGGYLWLRDSSLVAVTDVEVTGITASDGEQVQEALVTAAQDMTTMNVREDTLRHAVAPYASVGAITAKADFPHKLTIHVIEREPVAAIATGVTGAKRVPVTGGGILLKGITAERDLPSMVLPHAPAGTRITDKQLLQALKVAAQAPEPLLRKTDELAVDDRGVIFALHNGPELVFGSDQEAKAKWTAAARVLAEISAQGATYLDLRIPGRVAAGGLAPVATPTVDPNPQPEAENSPTLNP